MTRPSFLEMAGNVGFGTEPFRMIFCCKPTGQPRKKKIRRLRKYLQSIIILDQPTRFWKKLGRRKNTMRLLKPWQQGQGDFLKTGMNSDSVTSNMPYMAWRNLRNRVILKLSKEK